MNPIVCLRFVSTLAVASTLVTTFHLPLAAAEAATGGIAGRVVNRGTGVYLEGAEVTMPAAGLRTVSERDGTFRFARIPAGRHEVEVFYTGLNRHTQPVTVAPGGTADLLVELTSEVYRLQAFTVQGEREGNAASLTKQRIADHLVNVVSLDAFGNVADGNIGNFLQRLPGVAGLMEADDITGIVVRGTPPAWNSVSVDGVRSSAAFAGTDTTQGRGVVIDQIPADFIKEVELIKAPSPDVPADSIGGTANLVTKSALDVKEPLFTYRVGGNYNTYRDDQPEWTPTAAFTYLSKLGSGEKLGLALSGTYTEVNNFRDRLQMTLNQPDGRNLGFRTLDDNYTRIRSGGGIKLDYRPRPAVDLWGGVNYSYYSTQQERTDFNISVGSRVNVADYSRVSRAAIEAGTPPRTSANATTAGVAPGFTDTFTELLGAGYTNTQGRITRHFRAVKFDGGAKVRFGDGHELRVQGSYNPSRYKLVFENMTVNRAGDFGISIDTAADRQRPVVLQTYGPTVGVGADFSRFTATRTVNNDRYSEEEMANAKLDYERKWSRGRFPVVFKAGFNWRQQHHTIEVYQPRWNFVGPDGVAGRNSATGLNDDNLAGFLEREPGYGVFKNRYPQRDKFSYAAFMAAFRANPAWFRPVGTTVSAAPNFNDLTEDVFASYAMGRVQLGKMTLLGGLRHEQTEIVASGRVSDPRNASIAFTEREGSYGKAFPSAHLKYEFARGLIVRAAWTTGIARPDYDDLYPNTTVTYNDTTGVNVVRSNDPSLGPQFSTNYDLSAEYYFEPAGVVSAGWFRKEITDFIGSSRREIGFGNDNGFGGAYEGFDWITTRNFGDATIDGLEFNYNHQLTLLPKPLDTLAVFANYTRIRTSGNYGNDATELAQFVPRTANAGLSWRFRRFEARIAYNYQSGYLRAYNANIYVQQRNSEAETWDLNLQFALNRRFKLFADARNIFNEWPYWYSGNDTSRVVVSEVFGTRISVGVSGRF